MLDGTERNPPDPTYTCAVRMEHKRGVYKLKEEHEEKGSGEKKRSVKDINKKEENKCRKKELY